jgi:hypothetical protein
MRRLLVTGLLFVAIAFSVQASEPDVIEGAKVETLEWLALTDTGQYESSWDSASVLFKVAVAKEDWEKSLRAVRTPIGALETRKMATSKFSTTLPGAPDGEYVVFQFSSSFAHKATAVETVTAMKDTDGAWRVAGYFIK